jgi:hypothetical protein
MWEHEYRIICEGCGFVGFSRQSALKTKLMEGTDSLFMAFVGRTLHLRRAGKKMGKCPNCHGEGLIPLKPPPLDSIKKMFNPYSLVSRD